MEHERIFRDASKLAVELEALRRKRGAVVLANGCFDILHVGHIRYLREASVLGGILVVALNDDESARALKGAGRPVMSAEERAEILLALRYVDYVLIFSESTVDGIIRTLRPDFHAKGTDYRCDTVPERETASSVGCRTVIVGDPKDHSSRDIIGRVREGS
ncbi:MAG: adenylyltransferase/cytidyltransferase family protein [Candidatus Krumholzibacteria bacterium]|nr:adenylyltransferase/cytidyltransferase family protein [Candidatus Krumholzibacteria bacterium]